MRKSKKNKTKRIKKYTKKYRKCVYTDEAKRFMRITKELKKQKN
jgi:hypothetical protein